MTKNDFLKMYAERQKCSLKSAAEQCTPVLDCLEAAKVCKLSATDRPICVPPDGAAQIGDYIADLFSRLIAEGVRRASAIRSTEAIEVRPTGYYATRYYPSSQTELEQVRKFHPERVKQCLCCGRTFIAKNRRGLYCSEKCSKHAQLLARTAVKQKLNQRTVTINM